MDTRAIAARPAMRVDVSPTRLRGGRLRLARGAWASVALVTLGLWIAGLRLLLRGGELAFPPGIMGAVATIPLPGNTVAVALILLVMGVFAGTALLIYLRRPDDAIALFVSLALLTFGATITRPLFVLQATYPALRPAVVLVSVVGLGLVGLLPYLFPDGRFVPRWTRLLVAPAVALCVALSLPPLTTVLFTFSPDPAGVPGWLGWPIAVVWAGLLLAGVYAQVYRYRYVSGPVQRQQTKWVASSAAVATAWLVLLIAIPSLVGALPDLWIGAAVALSVVPLLLLPISIAYAILRYRLWKIDTLINRALVYGALTATLAALYWLGVVGLQGAVGWLTGQQGSQLAVVASTLAIAALFQPLRRRLQSFIDRRFYRRKYDTARTLAAFGATLRDETDLVRIQADLLAVVQETVQPAYASLWLRPPGRATSDEGTEPLAIRRSSGMVHH